MDIVVFFLLFLLLALGIFATTKQNKKLMRVPWTNLTLIDSPYSLGSVVIGRSKSIDYMGKHYYFFVYNNKQIDKYVSAEMIKTGGAWEYFLNDLVEHLVNEEKLKGKDPKTLTIVDAGANLGAFTLFTASLGCRVWAFEMQPAVYTLLELSIRVSGYHDRVRAFNLPLWNFTRTVQFSPVLGNLAGTGIAKDMTTGQLSSGQHSAVAVRIDSIVPDEPIFLLKLDVESYEEYVIGGIDRHIGKQMVKYITVGDSGIFHMPIYRGLYGLGYTCRNYGPSHSTNVIKGENCEIYAAQRNCSWGTLDALSEDFRHITRGHFNVLCTL